MDTRTKIVQALPEGSQKTIVGYFDPLHAGHIRRLNELCQSPERLVLVVADPPEPLLPTQARAEILAGLACVSHVLPAGSSASAAVAGRTVIDERTNDEVRSKEFSRHVLARHNTR